MRKDTTTSGSSGDGTLPILPSVAKSRRLQAGGEISIFFLKTVDIDVATEPII